MVRREGKEKGETEKEHNSDRGEKRRKKEKENKLEGVK